MTWLEFPLAGGQREDFEAKLLPNGTLTSVRNLRLEKSGRLGKRTRYNAVPLTSQHTGSAVALSGNTSLALASLGNDRLVVASEPARLYSVVTDLARVAPLDPDVDGVEHRPPTFGAPKRQIVRSQNGGDTGLEVDSATNNDYTVVVTADISSAILVAHVYSEADGGTLLYEQTLDTGIGSAPHVQCVAVGAYILVSWVIGTDLVFDVLDCTNTTGIAEFSGTPTVVGTVQSATSRPCLQARDDSGLPRAIFAWHSAAATITVELWAAPFTVATTTVGIGNTDATANLHVNVYANQTDNTSWVVWVDEDNGGGTVKAAAGDANFGSISSATISTDGTPESQPVITRYSAVLAVAAWDVAGEGVRTAHLNLVPASSSITTYYGWRIISNLMQSPYGGAEAYLMAYPLHSSAELVQRSYYLLAVDPVWDAAASNVVHARLADGHASFGELARPHLSVSAAGAHVFAWRAKTPQLGLSSVLWRLRSDGYDRGQPEQFSTGLYFSGGLPWRWDSASVQIAGFPEAPDKPALANSAGGSMTLLGVYSYVMVYEREEADGSLTLSAPSEATSVTLTGANQSAVVTANANNFTRGTTRIRLYRTLANGSVYYYVATDTVAGWLDVGAYSRDDGAADATISANHILYTQVGNVLGNDPMPACRYLFRSGTRLWAVGLEEAARARCSKQLFTGESAAFPATEEFSVSASDSILGGGSLDSTPVLFTARSITAVIGPGPDDAGAGLFETREIPCDSGLVEWGHRTIVETRFGLMYQSPEGIYLLPRGFGAPEYIGAPVRDTLDLYPYITSAVLVESAQEVRFTAVDSLTAPTEGVMLILDLRERVWIVSDVDSSNTPIMVGGRWGDIHVIAPDAISVLQETAAVNTSAHFESQVTTGDIRPGNVTRFGRCRKVQLLVEYRGECTITLAMSQDGGLTFPHSATYSLTAAAYTLGQIVPLEWHLPVQKATRFRLRATDSKASGGSAGVIYLGVALDLRQKSQGARVRAAQRN